MIVYKLKSLLVFTVNTPLDNSAFSERKQNDLWHRTQPLVWRMVQQSSRYSCNQGYQESSRLRGEIAGCRIPSIQPLGLGGVCGKYTDSFTIDIVCGKWAQLHAYLPWSPPLSEGQTVCSLSPPIRITLKRWASSARMWFVLLGRKDRFKVSLKFCFHLHWRMLLGRKERDKVVTEVLFSSQLKNVDMVPRCPFWMIWKAFPKFECIIYTLPVSVNQYPKYPFFSKMSTRYRCPIWH